MGGLIISCAALSILCIVLLVQKIILHHRIRKLTEQVDGFNSGTAEMLDVALQEDKLAQLQNGIADSQLALTRARQLNAEECNRTSQLTADISHQLKTPLTTLSFDINKYLSTQIYAHLRYDTSTGRIANTDWHRWQLKEILSFGFSYKFSTI